MSGSLLPNITYAAQNTPLYAASSGGGGGGGNTSSFQQVYSSSITTSTILVAGESQFNKQINAADRIQTTLGIWTSSISGTIAANTSTLIYEANQQGVYLINLGVTTGISNGFPMCGVGFVGQNENNANIAYGRLNDLGTQNIYTLSAYSPLNTPGVATQFYVDNSAGSAPTYTGAVTRLGL